MLQACYKLLIKTLKLRQNNELDSQKISKILDFVYKLNLEIQGYQGEIDEKMEAMNCLKRVVETVK